MRRALFTCAGLGLLLTACFFARETDEGRSPVLSEVRTAEIGRVSEGLDLLPQVRELNDTARHPAPPTTFKAGHVAIRAGGPKLIESTEAGFVVQLPSGAPVATPTVYRDRLYVSGGFRSKEFYCLDARTGKTQWGIDLDDDGPSSAVAEDGVIVFNTESCTTFAVDAKTGKQLWSWWLGDPLTSTPAIAGGRVFTSYPAPFGTRAELPLVEGKAMAPPSHVLIALELRTGKILWQRWIDSDVMSAPVAVAGELFFTSFAGVVYRVRQSDGRVLAATHTRATSAPTIVEGDIYTSKRADTGEGRAAEALVALSRESGGQKVAYVRKDSAYLDQSVQQRSRLSAQGKSNDAANGFAGGAPQTANAQAGGRNIGQATVSNLQAFQGSRVLNDGRFNFSCMGSEILCIDPRSGKTQWRMGLAGDEKTEGGFLGTAPVSAGGQLFCATLAGEVLRMRPTDGKVLARYKVGAPVRVQPAVVGGRIYVGTENGRVVCIDTGDAAFTGWTCWGGNAAHTGVAEQP